MVGRRQVSSVTSADRLAISASTYLITTTIPVYSCQISSLQHHRIWWSTQRLLHRRLYHCTFIRHPRRLVSFRFRSITSEKVKSCLITFMLCILKLIERFFDAVFTRIFTTLYRSKMLTHYVHILKIFFVDLKIILTDRKPAWNVTSILLINLHDASRWKTQDSYIKPHSRSSYLIWPSVSLPHVYVNEASLPLFSSFSRLFAGKMIHGVINSCVNRARVWATLGWLDIRRGLLARAAHSCCQL